VSPQEIQLIGGLAMGWVVQQFLRAPKAVPQWVSYAAIGVLGIGTYVLVTPAFGQVWHDNWRAAVAGMLAFLWQVRGQASTVSDAGVAHKTNTQ
jgi:hypothetical protein